MSLLDHLPFHKKKEDEPPDFSGDPFADGDDGMSKSPFEQQEAQQGTEGVQDPFAQSVDPFAQAASADPAQPGGAKAYAKQLVQEAQQEQPTPQGEGGGHRSDLQLILERLDTIKAELDSIKQRMYRFDRFMDKQEQHKVW